MGTGTSRIGSDPLSERVSRLNRFRSRPRSQSRPRARLSSLLLCGCSSSYVRNREKENFVEVGASSSKETRPDLESTSERSRTIERLSSNTEAGTSSEIRASTSTSRCVPVPNGLMGSEINKEDMYLKNCEELDQPNQNSVDIDHGCLTERRGTVVNTSFREQSADLVNASVNKEPNNGIGNSVNEQAHSSCICPRRPISQEPNEVSVSNQPVVDLEGFNLAGDTSVLSTVGPLLSSREQNGMNESLSHVGPVSTSSDNDSDSLELSSNPRISSTAAITSSSSERLSEIPNRNLSSDNRDIALSQNRRRDDTNDGIPTGQLGVNNRNEQRQHSRSEIWDIVFGSINENQRQTNSCPFGVHSGGSCSCDSFLTGEESSIHLSISRIVMLAEALFEVLDEMQPRPTSFPLPLSSHVAPDSVVDSFPLREYKKPESAESTDDVQQCYICLSEYEDGDKIRLLPCHHEYHMACVDKWLKEIHGICPLCRGDVVRGVNVNEGSNSSNPS